jgi:predicted lipase
VEVHNGFASEQARYVTSLSIATHPNKKIRSTAPTILSYVKQALTAHGASSVTIVGHSLGAALALIDGVYLRLQLPSATVRVVGYGMPRVGNQDFANWVDSNLGGHVTHVNNEEDPIPIVPGMFLGFHHASGEVHITDSGTWESCSGEFLVHSVSQAWCGLLSFQC